MIRIFRSRWLHIQTFLVVLLVHASLGGGGQMLALEESDGLESELSEEHARRTTKRKNRMGAPLISKRYGV